jgi:hypothetical protein
MLYFALRQGCYASCYAVAHSSGPPLGDIALNGCTFAADNDEFVITASTGRCVSRFKAANPAEAQEWVAALSAMTSYRPRRADSVRSKRSGRSARSITPRITMEEGSPADQGRSSRAEKRDEPSMPTTRE